MQAWERRAAARGIYDDIVLRRSEEKTREITRELIGQNKPRRRSRKNNIKNITEIICQDNSEYRLAIFAIIPFEIEVEWDHDGNDKIVHVCETEKFREDRIVEPLRPQHRLTSEQPPLYLDESPMNIVGIHEMDRIVKVRINRYRQRERRDLADETVYLAVAIPSSE